MHEVQHSGPSPRVRFGTQSLIGHYGDNGAGQYLRPHFGEDGKARALLGRFRFHRLTRALTVQKGDGRASRNLPRTKSPLNSL